MSNKGKLVVRLLLLLLAVVIVLRLTPKKTNYQQVTTKNGNNSSNNSTSYNSEEAELLASGRMILGSFAQKEFTPLLDLTHLDLKLFFKPGYSNLSDQGRYVDLPNISDFLVDPAVYVWGTTDGDGKPIKMTNLQYFNRYIYNQDFLKAPQISYNKMISKGTTESLEKIVPALFPNKEVRFIEYYFPGFEAKYEGMDWQSLTLIFQNYQNKWWLVAILHSEWGI